VLVQLQPSKTQLRITLAVSLVSTSKSVELNLIKKTC